MAVARVLATASCIMYIPLNQVPYPDLPACCRVHFDCSSGQFQLHSHSASDSCQGQLQYTEGLKNLWPGVHLTWSCLVTGLVGDVPNASDSPTSSSTNRVLVGTTSPNSFGTCWGKHQPPTIGLLRSVACGLSLAGPPGRAARATGRSVPDALGSALRRPRRRTVAGKGGRPCRCGQARHCSCLCWLGTDRKR